MPNFTNREGDIVTIEPNGGETLSERQLRDLAAYHAFEARQRVATTANISPDNVYQFRVTLPEGREPGFMRELQTQLRGLIPHAENGTIRVSREQPVSVSVELPREIYNLVVDDARQSNISPQERLRDLILLSQRFRFVEPERDNNAVLNRIALEQRAARS